MTEEEWLEYIRKLASQAAIEHTFREYPDSFNNPIMQELRYAFNDFDENLFPEYRKQKQVQPNQQVQQNNGFSLVPKQNNLMKPLQDLSTNIMQTMNKPLSNLNMPSNNKNNMFGDIMQKNQQTNLLDQTKQSLVKPQAPLQQPQVKPQQSQFEVQQKVQQQDQTQKPFWDKYKGLDPITQMQKAGSKLPVHSPAFQYYGISTKMADGEQTSKIAKEENAFYKLSDIKNQTTKDDYINKAAQMYGLDKNDPDLYEKVKNTKVVVPKVDSTLYNDIKNSEVTQRKVAEHYKILKEDPNKKLDTNIVYNKGKFPLTKEGGLYNSIKKANLNRSKINKDGSFDTRMDDGYDFEYNKKEVNLLKEPLEALSKFINNNAYEQQQKGKLEDYLLSAPIHYSKEELEEILRKLGLY